MKSQLEKQILYGQGNYAKIKEEVEGKVDEWWWSKGFAYSIEPFYVEEHNYPRQKRMKSIPENKNRHVEYGLDNLGKLIVARSHVNEGAYYETFYQIKEQEISSFHYYYGRHKPLIHCKLYQYTDGLLTDVHTGFKNDKYHEKYTHKRYIYKNKLLVSTNLVRYTEGIELKKIIGLTIYEYDAQNVLSAIRQGANYFYLREKALQFSKFKVEAEEKTIALFKAHIKKYKPKEKIYTINFTYTEQGYFPPQISYGLASEREAWLKTKEDPKWYIWNSAEYSLSYPYIVELEEQDKCFFKEFNQDISMKKKDKKALECILNVVIALKSSLHELNLNKTDDFAFVVSHYDKYDLKENFKIINPEMYDDFEKVLPS